MRNPVVDLCWFAIHGSDIIAYWHGQEVKSLDLERFKEWYDFCEEQTE